MPSYLQDLAVVDPFGVLKETANIMNEGTDTGLFSHIMHCFDSSIPSVADGDAYAAICGAFFRALEDLARDAGASYYGILNVGDARLRQHAAGLGLRVNHMLDRFYADLTPFRDLDHFIGNLPREPRQKMHRQLRKFADSSIEARFLAPPFDARLEELCRMCFETTEKHGTPQYFPAVPLARFARLCGDLVRLNVMEHEGRLVSGMICFEERQTLHLWSAGMRYDSSDFSPYAVGVAKAYEYAFAHSLQRIEAGRLNARIKLRLGFVPEPIYAITSERLPARPAVHHARQPATSAAPACL
ncbi:MULTISPECIES: GNAT family N-acetyltransferase [unclassified Janthinobacterium]|uniref:GNAT family N-acetyltransferase n=1 Tax=unclassified Janthinobacterium TaxID=2610881 RepID=UPI001587A339|nr:MULTISPECIES: GNAT family N-acetyltransferase [unclassified Janthinobacterium]